MDAGFYLVPSAQWGFGSSPVIAEGKVIVLCDVLTNPFLAAFDLSEREGSLADRTKGRADLGHPHGGGNPGPEADRRQWLAC